MHIRTTRSRQHRPVLGFFLLALATFVAYSNDFGLLGHGLHIALAKLVGHNGIDLATVTLCLSGTVCVLPPGTLVRVFIKLCGALVYLLVAVIEQLVRLGVGTVGHAVDAAKSAQKKPAKVIPLRPSAPVRPDAVLPPATRKQLDDVRGALKHFGYKPAEFEHIVAKMDGSQPVEMLVRDALARLKRKAN